MPNETFKYFNVQGKTAQLDFNGLSNTPCSQEEREPWLPEMTIGALTMLSDFSYYTEPVDSEQGDAKPKQYSVNLPSDIRGKLAIVTWDDEEYICQFKGFLDDLTPDLEMVYLIDNYTLTVDNNRISFQNYPSFPLFIMFHKDVSSSNYTQMGVNCLIGDDQYTDYSATHTLKIDLVAVSNIDSRFLPPALKPSSMTRGLLIPKTTRGFDADGYCEGTGFAYRYNLCPYDLPGTGVQCIVTWDNVEYTCMLENSGASWTVGDAEFSDYPFFIEWNGEDDFMNVRGASTSAPVTHTFKVEFLAVGAGSISSLPLLYESNNNAIYSLANALNRICIEAKISNLHFEPLTEANVAPTIPIL